MSKAVKNFFISIGKGVRRGLGAIKKRAPPISREAGLLYLTLGVIFALALAIRMGPARFGIWLNEFDPWYQYRVTDYVVKNGFSAYFNWHDIASWYPAGRDIARTTYPGMIFLTATLYQILHFLGVNISLLSLAALMPAVIGSLTVLVVFLIGREVMDNTAGILAALFLAISSAHIDRTFYGFYDTEFLALAALSLAVFFFVRAVRQGSVLHSALAGLAIGFMCTIWGAFRYPFGVLSLYVFIMAVMGRYSRRLLVTYSTTVGMALLVGVQVERVQVEFFRTIDIFVPLVGFAVLAFAELASNFKRTRSRIIFIVSSTGVAALAFLVLASYGMLGASLGRIVSVLDPALRSLQPLIASVGEHSLTTWASYYADFGIAIFFMLLGFYFLGRRMNDVDVFIITYGITAIYFSASMVRLFLILAPAAALFAGMGISNFLRPFAKIAREKPPVLRRRLRVSATVGRSHGAIAILLIFIVLTPTLLQGARSGSDAPMIVTSGVSATDQVPDWLEALQWITQNLPPDAVVASWWDYGYWITVIANRTSVADNATLNSTQIKILAEAMVSSEDISLRDFAKLKATHVVVFETFDSDGIPAGGGDYVKSFWMIKIAGFEPDDYIPTDSTTGRRMPTEKAANSTIYKMLLSPYSQWVNGQDRQAVGEPAYFTKLFESSGRRVFVYRIDYEKLGSL